MKTPSDRGPRLPRIGGLGQAPRLAHLLLLTLVVGILASTSATAQQADPPKSEAELTKIGELERFPDTAELEQLFGQPIKLPDGTNSLALAGLPLFSPATNRIYQLYDLQSVPGPPLIPAQVGVLVREAESREVVATLKVKEIANVSFFESQGPAARGAYPAAFDEAGKKIFFWVNRNNGAAQAVTALLTIDEVSLTYTYRNVPNLVDAPLSPATYPLGLFRLEGIAFTGGNLYVYLFNDAGNYLIKVDPATAKPDWSRRLRGCSRPYFEGALNPSGYVPILETKDWIYVPCASRDVASIVRLKLSEAAAVWGEERVFVGRGAPWGYLIDYEAQRIHAGVSFSTEDVLTFDVRREAWVGVQKVGLSEDLAWGLDPETGRLYTHSIRDDFGLSLLEGRRTPVPPGLRFPEFKGVQRQGQHLVTMMIRDPVNEVIYLPMGEEVTEQTFWILKDTPPESEPEPEDRDEGKTYDVEEDSLTGVSFSGEAGGYGSRALLVGGLRVAGPRDHIDVVGVGQSPEEIQNETNPCRKDERELIVARVSEARLSNSLMTAKSSSADADNVTELDRKNPSRCLPDQLEEGGPIPPEVGLDPIYDIAREQFDKFAGKDWPFEEVACTPEEPAVTAKPEDPLLGGFESSVNCSANSAQGAASARPAHPASAPPGLLPAVSVAYSSSSAWVRKDAIRGTVAVAESMVRGIDIGGIIQIDGIYARTETWAKGRPKTADSSYQRVIWGVRAPGFSCGACQDQYPTLADQLTKALGANGQVTLPKPDSALAKGSDGGYTAAVQRDRFESLTTALLNGDTLQEVPALEVILYNDHPHIGLIRRIFQFAGVKANAQYGVFCIGGLPVDGECPKPAGATVQIVLTDDETEPNPLPAGIFELHTDEDEDGLLGPLDPVVSGSTCVTDVTGTCALQNIVPGNYIIHQVSAPPGYAPAPDLAITMESGIEYTITFQNRLSLGRIEISLTDDSPEAKPLPGAAFEVFLDNGDQKRDPTDLLLATCATGSDGSCPLFLTAADVDLPGLTGVTQTATATAEPQKLEFVPLGAFVVHEKKAPEGYVAAEDVAFSLKNPGDAARLAFTNGVIEVAATPGEPPTQSTASSSQPQSDEIVTIVEAAPAVPVVASEPLPPQGIVGAIGRIVSAPADTARFIARRPKEASLIAAVWILMASPLWLAWRRRLLLSTTTRSM